MTSRSSKGTGPRRVALQQRDLAVMEALVQLRAETLDELHARFFAGLSRKRAVNRLAQLARAGYLHPADVILSGEREPTRVYTLGSKARAALEMRSLSSEHFRFRRWNPTLRDASIPHQVVVNRLGRELGVPLVPEHLLPVLDKNGARNRPDAVVEGIDDSGQLRQMGIEVDLGHYSRERIVGKLTAWGAAHKGEMLLFVVPDEARRAKVAGWVGGKGFANVCTRDSFSAAVADARADSGDGICFGLDFWDGGKAWEAEHERRRAIAYNEQWSIEMQRKAEIAREREAECAELDREWERQRQADAAAAERDRVGRVRRRFGV